MNESKVPGKQAGGATRAQDGCCTPVKITANPRQSAEQVKRLAALGDPTRLGIIAMLGTLDEPLCVCDIQANFDLGQPTISHHLKVLREAGLVTWEKRGLWVYYALNREAMQQLAAYLRDLAGARSAAPAPAMAESR